jgi:hypothetical protein
VVCAARLESGEPAAEAGELIRRQLGNSFGDFFDFHTAQYSTGGSGKYSLTVLCQKMFLYRASRWRRRSAKPLPSNPEVESGLASCGGAVAGIVRPSPQFCRSPATGRANAAPAAARVSLNCSVVRR